MDGEVIHSYTRAEAIADGVLIDVSDERYDEEVRRLPREAGFKHPIALTRRVFEECVRVPKGSAAERAGCDIVGRLWDVLSMLRFHIKAYGVVGDTTLFRLSVVRARVRPTPTTLKCVVGPGDDGEPVMTIMFPEED